MSELSDALDIARESIQDIKRGSKDSLFCLREVDPEKSFRLSYLREQFRFNEDLSRLFDRYAERIIQAYFSLFLLLQMFLSAVHFIMVLVINAESQTTHVVVIDLSFYSVTCILAFITLYLNEHYVKKKPRILKFLASFMLLVATLTDFTIPIYHSLTLTSLSLKPTYMTHIVISCYVFSTIRNNLLSFLLGISVTVCYLLMLGFFTYKQSSINVWEKLGSDLIYLLCINGVGIYFRYTNEIVKRRVFLDHRACVESTLKLKYEKEQEEQLMLSIIPEHTINEVRRDILNKIENVEKLLRYSTCDPLDIPYIHEYDNVTILYADIVNYTAMTSKLPVITLVETLNELFGGFDDASEELSVLRIKFLGDCYYCVAGLPPKPAKNHAEACVDLGLRMIKILRSVRERRNLDVDMRIGVHSGRILSGLIGSTKWQFDIWSKDVYLANMIETTGQPGKVHISKQTYDLITKPYNITPVNTGSTSEILKPYNVTTYLVSPDLSQSSRDNSLSNNNVAQINTSNQNYTFSTRSNGFLPKNCNNGNAVSGSISNEHYVRRESFRHAQTPTGILINKRPSGQTVLTNCLSGKRTTPNEVKRRTAFMDNNINRYNDHLKKIDENMMEAIEKMPLTKYEQWFKVKEISSIFLTFKNWKMEWEFLKLPDPLYGYYLLAYIILLIATTIILNLTLQQWNWSEWINYATLAFVGVILIPLTWTYSIWNKYIANSESQPKNIFLRCLYKWSSTILTCVALRIVIYLIMGVLFITCVLQEFIECQDFQHLRAFKPVISILFKSKNTEPFDPECIIPWHMSYTLSLVILGSFCFIRIHIALKLLFALTITIFYSISIWNFNSDFYKNSETFNYMMKPQIAHTFSLIILTITLHLIDRQTDYLNRLDFQWNKKLILEKIEVNTMHKITKMLLKNILPVHVAKIYLDVNRKSNVLYNEQYDDVAVIFATVVNYPTKCAERFFLALMNKMIKDFDYLLSKERGKSIEKIKVINLTYMAACGLDPGQTNAVTDDKSDEHFAVILLRFAVDLIKALKKINQEYQQECKLRIGIDNGAVMAGVVGSKKPLYDIWGNTVNVASRMDTTGIPGKIQITENTAQVLKQHGISCEFRDCIYVKGKGYIPTYFVRLTEDDELIYDTRL